MARMTLQGEHDRGALQLVHGRRPPGRPEHRAEPHNSPRFGDLGDLCTRRRRKRLRSRRGCRHRRRLCTGRARSAARSAPPSLTTHRGSETSATCARARRRNRSEVAAVGATAGTGAPTAPEPPAGAPRPASQLPEVRGPPRLVHARRPTGAGERQSPQRACGAPDAPPRLRGVSCGTWAPPRPGRPDSRRQRRRGPEGRRPEQRGHGRHDHGRPKRPLRPAGSRVRQPGPRPRPVSARDRAADAGLGSRGWRGAGRWDPWTTSPPPSDAARGPPALRQNP